MHRSQFVRALESLDLDVVEPPEIKAGLGVGGVGDGGVGAGDGGVGDGEGDEEEAERPTYDFERLILLFELFYKQDPKTMTLLLSLRFKLLSLFRPSVRSSVHRSSQHYTWFTPLEG